MDDNTVTIRFLYGKTSIERVSNDIPKNENVCDGVSSDLIKLPRETAAAITRSRCSTQHACVWAKIKQTSR